MTHLRNNKTIDLGHKTLETGTTSKLVPKPYTLLSNAITIFS